MSVPADHRVSVCVYCGARDGSDPVHRDAARRLGRSMVRHGIDLVYGGGHIGLMGHVADAVLEGSGLVTGVITEHLLSLEVGHDAVTELVVVADMPARKAAMFERSDGFVILPGGVGTMEEFFEVWCWSTLGLHSKPVGVLNTSGYYDPLFDFLRHTAAAGFVRDTDIDQLIIGDDPDELMHRLAERLRTARP